MAAFEVIHTSGSNPPINSLVYQASLYGTASLVCHWCCSWGEKSLVHFSPGPPREVSVSHQAALPLVRMLWEDGRQESSNTVWLLPQGLKPVGLLPFTMVSKVKVINALSHRLIGSTNTHTHTHTHTHAISKKGRDGLSSLSLPVL